LSDLVFGRWRSRSMWLFAAASLLTIGLGAAVMSRNGIDPGLWARNPIAWLVAGALAIFLARRGWLTGLASPLALIVIAFSLIGPEQEGVHRWIGAGPVQLNAAALVLPLAIAAFMRERWWLAVGSFAIIAGILAWQPDISQLAAFAIAGVVLCAARFGGAGAIGSILVAAAAVTFCLMRPDPLEPVPHVEGIIFLAFTETPVIATGMSVSLALASLSPLLLLPIPTARPAALALAAYFAATSLTFLVGAYPVPLAGYGLSFVIGWWIGFAALTVPKTGSHAG
jgi:cell division protein FtsW (lipid II flippase)